MKIFDNVFCHRFHWLALIIVEICSWSPGHRYTLLCVTGLFRIGLGRLEARLDAILIIPPALTLCSSVFSLSLW